MKVTKGFMGFMGVCAFIGSGLLYWDSAYYAGLLSQLSSDFIWFIFNNSNEEWVWILWECFKSYWSFVQGYFPEKGWTDLMWFAKGFSAVAILVATLGTTLLLAGMEMSCTILFKIVVAAVSSPKYSQCKSSWGFPTTVSGFLFGYGVISCGIFVFSNLFIYSLIHFGILFWVIVGVLVVGFLLLVTYTFGGLKSLVAYVFTKIFYVLSRGFKLGAVIINEKSMQ